MILAITLAFFALVTLLSFALRLAIYALPAWIGIAAGFAVVQHGGHLLAGVAIGFVAAWAALAMAQAALWSGRCSAAGTVTMAVFGLAAFVAGWQVFGAFTRIFDLDEAVMWLAPLGASVIAALAISRLRRPAV